MLVEQRGGGLRQRESDTRPYAERIKTVTTKLERFTLMAREEPQMRFTALMGLIFDPEGLLEKLRATRRTPKLSTGRLESMG